ncbi:MAG: hypothetical protein KatS3mg103_1419 [Phycisphaerales bacterium]|nr:MAG: hypothetical protein KatS3mg103_1419 [Phycisphaerales bacterium]
MLIPLGTDRPLRRTPWVTYALLTINILAYLVQVLATANAPSIIDGPVRPLVLTPGASGWWTWITYAFLHGGVAHLLGNMLFFWVFAQAVEDRFGHLGFAAFYLAGAAVTGLAHALFNDAPVIGASGAVACCTGAYLVLFPKANVRVLLFFVIIGFFVLPAWVFIVLAVAKDLLRLGMGSLGIAVEAHLAGYAMGFAVASALLASGLLRPEPYDLLTAFNQRRRRGHIRQAVRRAGLDRPMAVDHADRPSLSAEPDDPAQIAQRLRRAIDNALLARRYASAAESYRTLLDAAGGDASILPRDTLLDLANALYQHQDKALAARAYEQFLEHFPKDHEAPMVRVLLARLASEHLNDPQRALRLLDQALPELSDPAVRALAQEQLDALTSQRSP